MDNIRKININEMPKGFKLFLAFLPVLGFFLIDMSLDNDFYFLYPTGQYIVENGFPVKDFLSMHINMNIIVQQWLTDVIFYFIYSKLGLAGMLAFVSLCYIAFCFVMYKLLMLITENHFISCAVAFFADIVMAVMFMVTRPQAITVILIALEIYCLEKYVKSKSIKPLFVLPFISLLIINLHCSMWLMMFVFALPYVAAAIPFNFKKIKQEPCCKLLPLIICGAVCFALGFANPYGLKAMTYIFSSFGIKDFNSNIVEMLPPSISSSAGKVYFPLLFVMLAIIIALRKNNFTTRFVLLFAGTALLGLMNVKSIAYFVIGSAAAFSYYIKDCSFTLNITEGKRTKKEKRNFILIIALTLAITGGVLGYVVMNPMEPVNNEEEETTSSYEDMDKICDILKTEKDEIILYAGFNYGQYMEFKGYHPYIDGRAELFLEKNNGEFDYFSEHMDVKNGREYYKDFLDKYGFNYIIVDKETEEILETSLSRDGDYEELYSSESTSLYKLKS